MGFRVGFSLKSALNRYFLWFLPTFSFPYDKVISPTMVFLALLFLTNCFPNLFWLPTYQHLPFVWKRVMCCEAKREIKSDFNIWKQYFESLKNYFVNNYLCISNGPFAKYISNNVAYWLLCLISRIIIFISLFQF